jgi:hypothetical protein
MSGIPGEGEFAPRSCASAISPTWMVTVSRVWLDLRLGDTGSSRSIDFPSMRGTAKPLG